MSSPRSSPPQPRPARAPLDTGAPEVSLVIPMHNESAGLDTLFATLLPIIRAAAPSFEIVAVNDGSGDDTLQRLLERQAQLPQQRGKVHAVARHYLGHTGVVARGHQQFGLFHRHILSHHGAI